jgi:outer membrane receptor protein involved in Fe transport
MFFAIRMKWSRPIVEVSWAILLSLLPLSVCWGGEDKSAKDETMLMFVGENLSVLTVASRRPESAAAAPAIADVVDRAAIETRGFQTLGELLAKEPGFYMEPQAQGTVPFLRGIPNGILFLYDGVQVSTDVTKDLHPLDRELSLYSVKRVEIVRGPGSVLWGPDAFAGIVNVVPLTGRDLSGVETKVFGGSDRLRGGYVGWGHAAGAWDAFLSGYGAQDRYHNDTFDVAEIGTVSGEPIFSKAEIDDSYYLEFTGNAHVGDWLSVSGRYSDFKRRYTLQDVGFLSWEGDRSSPFSFLKVNISKVLGPSHWSLTGYYEDTRYEITDVDLNRDQKNRFYYGELLWDRRIAEKGLLTAGISYRTNDVTGAVVNGGFLPDFLKPENKIFVPVIQQADYSNDLKSVYAQYRHTWAGIDWWLGGRLDDHSQYESTFSYSLGMNWPLEEAWRVKATYGTAYRSPYSSQLFGGQSFDPEGISTMSLQLAWNPNPERRAALTAFYSKLTDHIAEDPYGGLSSPSDQEIAGVELSARSRVLRQLDLFGNLTTFHAWGGSEKFTVLQAVFVRPDGTKVPIFETWEEPFDTGPSFIANLGLTWRLHQRATLDVEGGVTSSVQYSFVKDTVSGRYSQPFFLDMTLRVKDVLVKNSELTLRGTNLLDRDYQVPGLYGPVDGQQIAFYAEWAYRF